MKQKILVVHPNDDLWCHTTYKSTMEALGKNEILHTTQLEFLSFKYAERLFVRISNDEMHEITLGACEGTDREIREAHNLRHMLLAGAFDYYKEGI